MADKVKHWPSWANWCARDEDDEILYSKNEPVLIEMTGYGFWDCDNEHSISLELDQHSVLELVEIDPNTPWQESKQRRPE